MSDAEPTAPKPRRTPLLLWLLSAVVVLTLALLGVSLFGPNPPIEIGKATTRITAPLAADGLPDYAAALLAESKLGEDGQPITPERNGAIPFLGAMWPNDEDGGALSAEDAAKLATALDTPCPPTGPRLEALESERGRAAAGAWLRQRLTGADGQAIPLTERQISLWEERFELGFGWRNAGALSVPTSLARHAESVLYCCQPVERPWTRNDLPFVAGWLDRNRPAIDRLVEAAERPEWFLPPPGLIDFERGKGFLVLLLDAQLMLDAAQTLTTRAMLSVGEGRLDEAAVDINAILRLADHGRRGVFLVDVLVACAIEGLGRRPLEHLLATDDPPVEQLHAIAATLDAIDSTRPLLRSLDHGERYLGLDTAIAISTGHDLGDLDLDGPPQAMMTAVAIDWNVVLRKVNDHYDALVAAAKVGAWPDRRTALLAVGDGLETRLAQGPARGRLAVGALTPRGRGALMGDVWLSLLAPGADAYFTADDRVTANRQLTRVAVALALHRKEHGDYPDALKALVPALLPKPPVDRFHGAALVYRKTDDGYLLYSLGANGQDDGGSCEEGMWGGAKLEGVEIETLGFDSGDASVWDPDTGEFVGAPAEDPNDPLAKIPIGADDISLRMPRQIDPWPWEVQTDDEPTADGS